MGARIQHSGQEELMEAYKALRGRLFQRYRSRISLTISEAVTERLYGRSSARAVDAEYRPFANHSREPWVPAISPFSPRSDSMPEDRQQLLSQDPLSPPCSEVSDVSWMFAEFDSDDELPSWAPVDWLGPP